jgi:hypothetical protein
LGKHWFLELNINYRLHERSDSSNPTVMTRFQNIICVLALSLTCATGVARDQWTIGDKAYDVDTLIFPHLVGPGVTAAKYDIPAMPLKVSVVEMDLTNPYITMETCL